MSTRLAKRRAARRPSGRISVASAYSMNRKPTFGRRPDGFAGGRDHGAASTAMRMPEELADAELAVHARDAGMSLNGRWSCSGRRLPPPVKNPLSTAVLLVRRRRLDESPGALLQLDARDSRSSSDSYPQCGVFALVPASSSNICWFSNLSRTRCAALARFAEQTFQQLAGGLVRRRVFVSFSAAFAPRRGCAAGAEPSPSPSPSRVALRDGHRVACLRDLL